MISMNFPLPWLLWRLAAEKKRKELAKACEELGKSEIVAELAERDPKTREALQSLGVKIARKEEPPTNA
jgi:hypothetical protein